MPLENNNNEGENFENININKPSDMTPLMCKNVSCGFFGSISTFGFCSICYKSVKGSENFQNEEQNSKELKPSATPVSNPHGYDSLNSGSVLDKLQNIKPSCIEPSPDNPPAESQNELFSQNKNLDDTEPINNHNEYEQLMKLTKANDLVPKTDEKASGIEDRKIEDKCNTKCNKCQAKLSHVPIQCKCGLYFCRAHRSIKAHGCTFDFKQHQSQYIREKLPHFKSNSNVKDI